MWEKIEDYLFEKYCVEGEDKELTRLMIEHDADVRANTANEFAERLKEEYKPFKETDAEIYNNVCDRFDKIAEQIKSVEQPLYDDKIDYDIDI